MLYGPGAQRILTVITKEKGMSISVEKWLDPSFSEVSKKRYLRMVCNRDTVAVWPTEIPKLCDKLWLVDEFIKQAMMELKKSDKPGSRLVMERVRARIKREITNNLTPPIASFCDAGIDELKGVFVIKRTV